MVQTLFLKTFWHVLLHPALVPLGKQTTKHPTNQRTIEIATMFYNRHWTWASFWVVNWLPTRAFSRNVRGWQQESIMVSLSLISPLWQHLGHGAISVQLDRKELHFPECAGTGQPPPHRSTSYWGFFLTFIPWPRLSRELISNPSLQACRQEITFWLSIFPGRMVRLARLPWKNWANRGLVTSPPKR